ncbi:hypothetical protein D3C80_1031520 [compost metagenome]
MYFTLPSRNVFKAFTLSFFIVSDSFFVRLTDFPIVSIMMLFLSFCSFAGITVFFFVISCEYKLPYPIVRKIDNKTILNKFVRKGLNTIFVKLWLVF